MLTKIVNGNEVELTQEEETALSQTWEKNGEEVERTEYIRNRLSKYPSIPEQLDLIYHVGFDEWKAQIKIIKDKYPKPQE